MYQFKILPHFKKQLKILIKKYKGLKRDVVLGLENFDKRNSVALGQDIYKLRLKSSDINKGKSGGFRLIIFIYEIDEIIFPIAIYSKSERENISVREIKYHLTFILNEINDDK